MLAYVRTLEIIKKIRGFEIEQLMGIIRSIILKA
jgi:hypothetical protein